VRCGMKTKALQRPLPDDEARDRDALRYDLSYLGGCSPGEFAHSLSCSVGLTCEGRASRSVPGGSL
jgi:hypothetical protein